MGGMTESRAVRDIVASMGDKVLFAYIPEMEISVPESDRRNSLDKIACYYHAEQFVLSDLYIGYAISLYRYTIPKVVAATVKVLGNFWPQKNVPKNIDREALLSRIKKICGMGMLRREQISEKESCQVQLVVVCEDVDDFRKISTMICNVFPEHMLGRFIIRRKGR